MTTLARLHVGKRFKQEAGHWDNGGNWVAEPPVFGTLVDKTPCRAVVKIDSAIKSRTVTFSNGKTATFNDLGKVKSWALTAEVEEVA